LPLEIEGLWIGWHVGPVLLISLSPCGIVEIFAGVSKYGQRFVD